jgi:hypothetical protein
MRVVEFQDWATPPTSPDDDFGGGDDEDGSDDSNYNGYWLGFEWPSRSSFGPWTVRLDGAAGAPSLGRSWRTVDGRTNVLACGRWGEQSLAAARA